MGFNESLAGSDRWRRGNAKMAHGVGGDVGKRRCGNVPGIDRRSRLIDRHDNGQLRFICWQETREGRDVAKVASAIFVTLTAIKRLASSSRLAGDAVPVNLCIHAGADRHSAFEHVPDLAGSIR